MEFNTNLSSSIKNLIGTKRHESRWGILGKKKRMERKIEGKRGNGG
jgi:hypothetical protein